jgi:hypothetical protein
MPTAGATVRLGGSGCSERGGKHVLELLQRERLDEICHGLEIECLAFCGKDAREDDRTTELANVPCEAHAGEVAWLDHCSIDVRHRPAVPVGVYSLVSKPSDDVLQKRTDVGMRLDDQDPCHSKMIRDSRWDPVRLRV